MDNNIGTVDVVIIDRYHWISDDRNHEAYENPGEAGKTPNKVCDSGVY